MSEHVSPCPACGGPVVIQGAITGTRYYVPVAEEMLQTMMENADTFLHERLQRAERIIVELRKQVKSGS